MRVSAQDMNQRLRSLYLSKWSQLISALSTFKELSWPLLVAVPPAYDEVPIRVMIVGQQTDSWSGNFGEGLGESPVDAVDKLMCTYTAFDLGRKYGKSFFNTAHRIQRLINPGYDTCSFVWSNLVKIDERRGRPSHQVEELISGLGLLQEEIKIVCPEVIVFFTGWYYDERLLASFPGVQQHSMAGCSQHLCVRLAHPDLPRQSYRTYHPNYLRRSKQGGILDQIASMATK